MESSTYGTKHFPWCFLFICFLLYILLEFYTVNLSNSLCFIFHMWKKQYVLSASRTALFTCEKYNQSELKYPTNQKTINCTRMAFQSKSQNGEPLCTNWMPYWRIYSKTSKQKRLSKTTRDLALLKEFLKAKQVDKDVENIELNELVSAFLVEVKEWVEAEWVDNIFMCAGMLVNSLVDSLVRSTIQTTRE
jgi:hypothetical protein